MTVEIVIYMIDTALVVSIIHAAVMRIVIRRRVRVALRELVTELFTYNRRDGCWDPIGSLDKRAAELAIEVIARGRLRREQVVLSRELFNGIKEVRSVLRER